MLIRSMMKVNPDRRSDIDEIASHWWLNLEDNMPVIQELPENQITDPTPLTERAETIVVQDLADETDVFMEFGHLSAAARRKIEEFRRRKKQAEQFLDQSPVKIKSRRTDQDEPNETAARDVVEMNAKDLSLRTVEDENQRPMSDNPMERLKALESRLKQGRNLDEVRKEESSDEKPTKSSSSALKEIDDAKAASPNVETATFGTPSYNIWRLETDSLNMFMNQLLEQMEKGPVSMRLVARIRAHPFYQQRPMVKQLLESILEAQTPAVQKQASKIIEQQSQTLIHKSSGPTTQDSTPSTDAILVDARSIEKASKVSKGTSRTYKGERPWISVEVGFDPDEDQLSSEPTIDECSIETNGQEKQETEEKQARTGDEVEVVDFDLDLEELAEEVEQNDDDEEDDTACTSDDPCSIASPPIFGTNQLSRRLSKGKYFIMTVNLYGRGISGEGSTLSKRKIGGVQPSAELAPYLFDKAKQYILDHPEKGFEVETKCVNFLHGPRWKTNWLRTQDPDVMGSSMDIISHSLSPAEKSDGKEKQQCIADNDFETGDPELANESPARSSSTHSAAPHETAENPRKIEESQLVAPLIFHPDAFRKSPTPEDKNAYPYSVFLPGESANAYIRRKNREREVRRMERRQRNKTIGTTDELTRMLAEDLSRKKSEEEKEQRELKDMEANKTTEQNHQLMKTAYRMTLKTSLYDLKLNRRNSLEATTIPRRKVSLQEIGHFVEGASPLFESLHFNHPSSIRCGQFQLMSKVSERKCNSMCELDVDGVNDEEASNLFVENETTSPKHCDIYSTKVEKLSNFDRYSPAHQGIGSTAWYDMQMKIANSKYEPASYRSRVDDVSSYRKSVYDSDTDPNPGRYNSSNYQNEGKLSSRTRSVERKSSKTEVDDNHFPNKPNRARFIIGEKTPTGYSYVNYYDSSGQNHQPGTATRGVDPHSIRGILKNRQSVESEPIKTDISTNMNVFGRLKKRLSFDKKPMDKGRFSDESSIKLGGSEQKNYEQKAISPMDKIRGLLSLRTRTGEDVQKSYERYERPYSSSRYYSRGYMPSGRHFY